MKGHETRDASMRGILIFVIGFIVTGAVIHGLLWLTLKQFASDPREVDVPLSAVQSPTDLPPGAPPLQPRQDRDQGPRTDLVEMKRREDAVFTQLGWKIDPQTQRPTPPVAVLQAVSTRPRPTTAPASTAPATQPVVTPIPGVDQGGGR